MNAPGASLPERIKRMPMSDFSNSKVSKKYGNALTEYSLITALVAVCAITSLSMLGLTVSNGLSGMLDRGNNQQSAGNQPVAFRSSEGANPVSVITRQAEKNVNFDMAVSDRLIQTAGVNGDVDQVNSNSARLLALAQKYEENNPQLSNALIILAQKGQTMAQAIHSENQGDITDTMADFLGYFSGEVVRSGVFTQLSSQDQALVKELSNQNIQLSAERVDHAIYGSTSMQLDDYTPAQNKKPVSATVAASQVNENAGQTKYCGQNLKCKEF